jgi:redox-sensing transcriptional repressor
MGKALASYENFRKRGFDIVAVFDVDEKKIGTKINDIEVYSTDKIPEFVAKTKVDIAILTVPNKKIIDVAKEITSLGIKAIWNFSPTDLRLGEDVVVENVHLSDSLMVLGYRLREKDY